MKMASVDVLIFALLIVSKHRELKGQYLGEINCEQHAQHLDCLPPKRCTVTCPAPCAEEGLKPIIWGSRAYTYDSPICRSAVHDYRIPSWSSPANVTFQRVLDDPAKYLASIQQGVFSTDYGRLGYHRNGYFIFTSPYITEDILDVSTVNINFLYDIRNGYSQQCHVSGQAERHYLDFRFYIPATAKSNGLPVSSGGMYWHEVTWMYPNLNPGGYWCNLNNNTFSDVMSVAMRSDANFVPDQWTITVSIQEDVSLKFTQQQNAAPFRGYEWRKDEGNFRLFNNMRLHSSSIEHYLDIGNVDVGDAGIYSLEFKQKQFSENGERFKKRGIVRLIVRRCQKGYFGPTCSELCPMCLNGGMCHDVMGTCICPPGFNGTNCENACPEDNFGQKCSKRCDATQHLFGSTCKAVLICLPDPYGCSCAAGYKGLACDQNCEPGEYGANCLQKRICHCAGNQSCNVKSGLCLGGCSEGWKNAACSISYPALRYPPTLVAAQSMNLKIEFSPWDASQIGEGKPAFYIVELKEDSLPSATWKTMQILKSEHVGTKVQVDTATMGNLQPATGYAVRVIVQDEDENMQRELAPMAVFNTTCGSPSLPPEKIQINTTLSKKVSVSWNKPPRSTWNCNALTVTLKYSNSENAFTEQGITDDSYEFDSKPFTTWIITARFDTNNDQHSDWTNPISGLTAQDAPGPVQNVTVSNVSDGFRITWEKPTEENGVITNYEILLLHYKWRHQCSYQIDPISFSESPTRFELIIKNAIEASSVYKVSVTAETVKRGATVEQLAYTEESIPDAGPQQIQVNVRTSTQLMLKWEAPPCQLMKGSVSSYILTYTGQQEWDKVQRNLSVGISSALLPNLIPYTTYLIRVQACTNLGCSEKYAEIEATTRSQSPLEPTNVTIYRTTESTLAVAWKPPYPPYGTLNNYYIYFKERNEHKFHYFVLNATRFFCNDAIRSGWVCYTIVNLGPRKCYSVYVVAENDAGSSTSTQVSGETEESVPDPPAFVHINSSTENSLDIMWQEPYRSNGNLTGYKLNVTVISSYGSPRLAHTQIYSIDLNNMTLNVSGLLPATKYNISVSASTKKGHGLAAWEVFTTRNAEPEIHVEPEVGLVTKTTVDLLLKPLDFTSGPISAYYVLVREMGSGQRRKRSAEPTADLLVDYNTSQAEGLKHYAAAKFLPSEVPSRGINITVGDGQVYGGYYNAPLATGTKYHFGMAVLSNYSGDVRVGYRYISKSVTVEELVASTSLTTTGAVVGAILVLVLLCIVAVLFIIYKEPKWLKTMKRASINKFQMMNQNQGKSCITESMESLETAVIDATSSHTPSHIILVDNLENYVQIMTQNEHLEEEYKSVNKKQTHLISAAKLPENKSKNRYGNLLPYDHSRVIIEKNPGDSFSHYINASYISGYKEERKYIATQGPKQHTVADFWKMVWQENVDKIIMTTNLSENGKVKCEKYWPDTSESYGQITATLLDTEMYADYVIRTFQINKEDGVGRQIRQFHFTSWPDHGVPLYPVAIGGFLKRVHAYNPNSSGPIIVHCSAGVGRTGTIILIDSMIEMGRAEGKIDALEHLHKIREQRMNLVETYEQYEFVLRALADILCGEETSILCSNYYTVLGNLQVPDPKSQKTQLQMQFERLEKLSPPLQNEDCKNGHSKLNQDKNRNSAIVPPDSSRVLLPTSDQFPSNYINAVYINGYKQKDAFIVTQVPLENTCAGFWRMVSSSRTSTIVLLHGMQKNDYQELYWPEGASAEYGSLTVEHISSEMQGDVVLRTFNLKTISKKNNNSSQVVRQFHLQNWYCNDELPSAEVITDLIEKVERWQKQSRSPNVIVQCLDGACASGIFCASVFICDKIKVEQEVDVFLAVRSIRTNRPQFVNSLEQYTFLHQVALTFLDSFETYANFQ